MSERRPGGRRGSYTRITDSKSGLVFVFAPDADAPELLHIFARHATEPADAIETFFDSSAEMTWNHERQRTETYSATHGLYWFWITPNQVVMVISCFRLPEV